MNEGSSFLRFLFNNSILDCKSAALSISVDEEQDEEETGEIIEGNELGVAGSTVQEIVLNKKQRLIDEGYIRSQEHKNERGMGIRIQWLFNFVLFSMSNKLGEVEP